MLHQMTNHTNTAAPLTTRSRFQFQVQLGASPADITGENRLESGESDAINGFTITGCDAHAAVCMHVAPATGTPWSADRKGKYVATIPSAGMLRTS